MIYKSGCILFLLATTAAFTLASDCNTCDAVKPVEQPCDHPVEQPCQKPAEQPCETACHDVHPDTTVKFTDDLMPLPGKEPSCKTAWARISNDKRLTIFTKLALMFGANVMLDNPTQVVTVVVPTDAAILKACGGKYGYTLHDILALPAPLLQQIFNNHIIPNMVITSADVASHVLTVPTILTQTKLISLQVFTGQWEKLCFVPTNNFTEGCARCGNKDLTSCAAVVHIIDFLLLFEDLPALPPAPGCASVYNYISARHDMADLKAAIDLVGLQSLFNGTRTPGTYFLPTDYAIATLIQLNSFPRKRLADMDAEFIEAFLRMHVIPSATIYSYQFVSGQTYETAIQNYWVLADVNCAKNNLVMIWNEVSNVTVTEADIPKCSAVVHVINTPLTLVGYHPITMTDVCSTYGPFKSVADLLAACPALSGMYDLVGASALAEVAASCTTFGTWFIPSNQALCRMASRGLPTEVLLGNKQLLLNFVNSQVLPYSSLPFASLVNGVVLKTAFTPATIQIQKVRTVSGETENNAPGNVEVNMFSVVDNANRVAQINFSSWDLQCGKAIANVVEDALLSPALSPSIVSGKRRLSKRL